MGYIDIKIKKPAWKRTDVVEVGEEIESSVPEEASASGTGSRSRLRRTARMTGGVVVGALSLLTLHKLRSRRSKKKQAVAETDE